MTMPEMKGAKDAHSGMLLWALIVGRPSRPFGALIWRGQQTHANEVISARRHGSIATNR